MEKETIDESGVVIAKIISGSCLFVVSVICGVIPFKLAKIFKWAEPADPNNPQEKKSPMAVNILLCFGGGVLLSTTFLHCKNTFLKTSYYSIIYLNIHSASGNKPHYIIT